MSRTHEAPPAVRIAPPDQAQRQAALHPDLSVIVQAPAGSGKTDLLTRRFLRMLAEVEDPGQIVAITFTKAAAAEMQQRIVSELEKARNGEPADPNDEFSMQALAARALQHAEALGWNLLDSPSQLRISTIDSFCREIAIQQPLVSGFPGALNVVDNAAELYRRAARRTLQQIDNRENVTLTGAIESLLTWRDNNWKDVEDQLVGMLEKRDRWMQGFVLDGERDWEELRRRLEAPFVRAVSASIERLSNILARYPDACAEAHFLARFACAQNGMHRDLAELADFPCGPFETPEALEEARIAFLCLANMLLTKEGEFRSAVNKSSGFPASAASENERMRQLVSDLRNVPGLLDALRGMMLLPPAGYTEDEWRIVRACFTLLRHAAGELRVVFEDSGAVDFVEIAQRAQLVLEGQDQLPTDAGMAIADRIHHLLVDEFQDTSRRQHKLITSLVKAWPELTGRTVFVVGDPMQSIYFFRDAEAELFQRVRSYGLENDAQENLALDPLLLQANFRTAHQLVRENNELFAQVFGVRDGSGIEFFPSIPARSLEGSSAPTFSLHLEFVPENPRTADASDTRKMEATAARQEAHKHQLAEIVKLIRAHDRQIQDARTGGDKYRIAILGRTRNALAPIAAALRQEEIPFRALDMESLADRPEVLDALALARAILNPEDRVAWLSVLRAPWCGLRADELHTLVSADDHEVMSRTVPSLIDERADLLSEPVRSSLKHVRAVLDDTARTRRKNPEASLGTWLRSVWEQLGGRACVDATGAENIDVLWNCLDSLPNGEVDLLGDGLKTKLSKLTAQADPDASSGIGVQLMTIHKSKGLEFEVVIVPELQARCGLPERSMLSWLERGLANAEEGEAPTEFLIAPLQSKGSERSSAKAWVDRMRRERERQETRRILYVASTRAREELHFFARPEFKENSDSISPRADSLLDTAWSAIGDEVKDQFATWNAKRLGHGLDIAAGAKLLEMPSPKRRQNASLLLRLRANSATPTPCTRSSRESQIPVNRPAFERHKGGIPSRAFGTGVHVLLEQAAHVRTHADWVTVKETLTRMLPSITARMRSFGLCLAEAMSGSGEALDIALAVLNHPVGAWVLSPHLDAENEAAWTDWNGGAPRTVRVDRIFRAGASPMEHGEDTWWIVDYKTAHLELRDGPEAVAQTRALFEDQLQTYAHVLRTLRGQDTRVHAGLYYPRLQLFDWWKV